MKLIMFLFLLLCSINAQHIVALRAEFIEDSSSFTTGNGLFNMRVPGLDSIKNHLIDPPPHNKSYFESHLTFATNYYKKLMSDSIFQSSFSKRNGNYFSVFPAEKNRSYKLSKKMYEYYPNLEKTSEGFVEIYTETYNIAISEGVIINENDIVIIFHAGVGADISLGYTDYTPHDIPSISLGKTSIDEFYNGSWAGKSYRGILLPETASQEGLELAINGLVVAHIGTALGFLDLVNPVKESSMVGPWGLEDRGLFNVSGLLPSKVSAFNREFKGLDKPIEFIAKPTKRVLSVDWSEKENPLNPLIIKIPINENEYYLIENRYRPNLNGSSETTFETLRSNFTPLNERFLNPKQIMKNSKFDGADLFMFNDSTGVLENINSLDLGIPHSGILIWHVDKRVIQEKFKSNRINESTVFPGVTVLEADGVNNFTTGGDGLNDERYDVFYAGNKAKYYTGEINDLSYPNTSSTYEKSPTGIIFNDFSKIGETMSFSVRREVNFIDIFEGTTLALKKSGNELFRIKQYSGRLFLDKISEQNELISTNLIKVGEFTTANFFEDHFIFSSVDSLYLYNGTLNQTHSYNLNSALKKMFILESPFFLTEENNLIKLVDTALETVLNNVKHIESVNDILVVETFLGEFYKVNERVERVELKKSEIAHISDPVNDALLSISITKNIVNGVYSTGVTAYEYPKKVPYKFEEQTIKRVKQIDNELVLIDEKNIIKILTLNKTVSYVPSFYVGNVVNDVFITNNTVYGYTDLSIFQFRIDRKSDKQNTLEMVKQTSELNEKTSFIYPNPAINKSPKIRIATSAAKMAKVDIFYSTGRFFSSFEIELNQTNPTDYTWNTSEVPSGTYIIHVTAGHEQLVMKAVVIHR